MENKNMKKLLGAAAVGSGLIALYTVSKNKKNPENTLTMIINSSIDKVFNYVLPINLTHIFRGSMIIPAIINTSIKEGWDHAGLVRTLYFKGGSTSRESLLTMSAPKSFSYKNDRFTSPLFRSLIESLEGEWSFTDLGNEQTKIEWTYRAIPKNSGASVLIDTVLMKQVNSMQLNALTIIKKDLESNQLAGTKFAEV